MGERIPFMDYRETLEKFKIPIAIGMIGLVLIIGGGVFTSTTDQKSFPKESIINQKSIQVDISGAVINPGVYSLLDGARVGDAIKFAGGVKDNANQEFVSKQLNLAKKVSDGDKIYIPFEGETVTAVAGQGVVGITATGQININTATQEELESLPGIGPVIASKIVSGRPYQSLDELVSKKIVGKTAYEKIKDLVIF